MLVAASVLVVFTLTLLVGLSFWQSSYGYFMRFSPIPKPGNFLNIMGPNPDQRKALANPDSFIRIGFTLESYNNKGFVKALPNYDYNVCYLEEFFRVTVEYYEPPFEGLPDFGNHKFDFLYWLVVSLAGMVGMFAARQYLKDI